MRVFVGVLLVAILAFVVKGGPHQRRPRWPRPSVTPSQQVDGVAADLAQRAAHDPLNRARSPLPVGIDPFAYPTGAAAAAAGLRPFAVDPSLPSLPPGVTIDAYGRVTVHTGDPFATPDPCDFSTRGRLAVAGAAQALAHVERLDARRGRPARTDATALLCAYCAARRGF